MNSATRSGLVVAATVVVVALLLWAGVHNMRQRKLAMQQASDSHAVLMPDKAGSSNGTDAGQAGGPAPVLQGKVAPGFTLVDLDGRKVSLADYKGKPVLVNSGRRGVLLASWRCPGLRSFTRSMRTW